MTTERPTGKLTEAVVAKVVADAVREVQPRIEVVMPRVHIPGWAVAFLTMALGAIAVSLLALTYTLGRMRDPYAQTHREPHIILSSDVDGGGCSYQFAP